MVPNFREKVRSSQMKAITKVNTELITLYLEIGKNIVEKQQQSNWGDALIEQLSIDLISEFSSKKGFSRSNLFYIRKWFLFYSTQLKETPQTRGLIEKGATWQEKRLSQK